MSKSTLWRFILIKRGQYYSTDTASSLSLQNQPSFLMCYVLKNATNICRVQIHEFFTIYILTQSFVQRHFQQTTERYENQCRLRGPAWHGTTQGFMLSVKHRGEKINVTWQRYIKSLCASSIFLILPVYFCLLCTETHSPGPAGENNVGIQERKLHVCCICATVSAVTQGGCILYRPFHSATSSITADSSDVSPLHENTPQPDPRTLRWQRGS